MISWTSTAASVRGVGVVLVVLVGVVVLDDTVGRTQLALERVEVGLQRLVLQPTGDLRLLGLGPAAPHRVDPLAQNRGDQTAGRPRNLR